MEERFLEAVHARGYNASISKASNQNGIRIQINFGNGDFYIRVREVTEANSTAMLAAADSLRSMRPEDNGEQGPMIFRGV